MASYMQGFYKPENPHKFVGDIKGIVYRSSWELKYLRMIDTDPNVVKCSSEEVIIPYRDHNGSLRRYFVDFYVKYADGKEILVEIKPSIQTVPPVPGKKKRKTLLREAMTYGVNQLKWEAARKYAKKRGWEVVILTEKERGIK
jgi:hypothetical protein